MTIIGAPDVAPPPATRRMGPIGAARALGLLALVWWICSVTLLAGGPEPFWATRWAWFWLSLLPGGVIACLLLSGPAPLLPSQRAGTRRLTGGWALLAVVAVHQLT